MRSEAIDECLALGLARRDPIGFASVVAVGEAVVGDVAKAIASRLRDPRGSACRECAGAARCLRRSHAVARAEGAADTGSGTLHDDDVSTSGDDEKT